MMLDQVIDEWIETNCRNQEEADTARKGIDANLARIRRKAKAEALREAAERVSQLRDVSCMARDGMTDRQAAMERDYQYFRESPVGWLLDRADRMEAGEQ